MNVVIKAIHFDATDNLEEFINKKVVKLERYYDDITSVDVALKVVKPEVAENKEVLLKVLIPNGELVVTKVADTFEQAADECIEALEKQLKKLKEKQSMGI